MAIVNTSAVVSIFPEALGQTLPSASEATAGIVAVGKNLQIVDGKLTVKDVVTANDLEVLSAKKLLVDLGSEDAVPIFSTEDNMGIIGILPVAHGGTGATSASASRDNLNVYSKVQTTNAIKESAASVSTALTQAIDAATTPIAVSAAQTSAAQQALAIQLATATQDLSTKASINYVDTRIAASKDFDVAYDTTADLLSAPTPTLGTLAKTWDTQIIYRYDGDVLGWVALGLSPVELAEQYTDAVMDTATKDLLIAFNKIVDSEGNHFPMSILNTAINKLLFGVTAQGGMQIGNLTLRELEGQWVLMDGVGRTFLRYKDEQLYIMNYKVTFGTQGFRIMDHTGRALFSVSPSGAVYASKYHNIPEYAPGITLDYQLADAGQYRETDIVHIMVYGQSLSVSTARAIPLQSVVPHTKNIMLKGGVRLRIGDTGYDASDFAPLVEASKETPCSGICNGLTQRIESTFGNRGAVAPIFLGTTTGDGGKTVQYLSPVIDGGNASPSRFSDTIETVRQAKALADQKGKSYAVGMYPYIQGENDSTTPIFKYSQQLRNLKQRFDQEIIAVTGQRYKPYMVMMQTAAHRRYSRNYFGAALAQARLANEHPDMVLAAPIYQLPHSSDALHLDGFGAWLMGQYIARASFHTMYLGEKWKPLQPSWVKWNGTEILVGGWNPKGTTLVIDDALCALTENSGFDLFSPDDSLIDIISSVELVDTTTIKITLSQEAPIDARLTCGRGRDSMNGTALGGPLTGARTNIRDNQGDFDEVVNPLDSSIYKMHNASIMWQYDRQNQFNSI